MRHILFDDINVNLVVMNFRVNVHTAKGTKLNFLRNSKWTA